MFEIRLKKRIISPAYFQSESLAKLPFETRILFQGMWCAAELDEETGELGLLPDKPIILKSLLFPYDNKLNLDKMIQQLHDNNTIVRYEAGAYNSIWIPHFKDMQPVHPQERKSKIPPPSKEIIEKQFNLIKSNGSMYSNSKGNSESKNKSKEVEPTKIEKQIIDDFNMVTGKNVKYSPTHINRIRTRLKEGFMLADFKKVHIYKTFQWKDDDKMSVYIRPETLHSTKFDSYLNEGKSNAGTTKARTITRREAIVNAENTVRKNNKREDSNSKESSEEKTETDEGGVF